MHVSSHLENFDPGGRQMTPTSLSAGTRSFIAPRDWTALCHTFSLSPRESEVARLILEELDEQDIASNLGIAQRTVRAHVEHLYRKLGVHSRYQLVIRLFREYVRLDAHDSTIRPIG
jgi:DNA-binding NarL/FixJ family response regulator